MALHGLASLKIGVPDLAAANQFYTEFGLRPLGDNRFATTDGGDQLELVHQPVRGRPVVARRKSKRNRFGSRRSSSPVMLA